VKYKIIIGFYDSHCVTVNTRHEVSQKYVAVFCFMFATCVLNESACIHINDIWIPENYIIYHYFCNIHISSVLSFEVTDHENITKINFHVIILPYHPQL